MSHARRLALLLAALGTSLVCASDPPVPKKVDEAVTKVLGRESEAAFG
jgi:hypothetical protein